jgi:hypothetical protein
VTTARRIGALRALIAGASCAASLGKVDREILELAGAAKVQIEKRKHLMQILHATRALDSALGEALRSYGIGNVPFSLGDRLWAHNNLPVGHPSHLASHVVHRFIRMVCRPRNTFMHEADAFPRSYREADALISEIEACFTMVLR